MHGQIFVLNFYIYFFNFELLEILDDFDDDNDNRL